MKHVKDLRTSAGMSQQQLADAAQVSIRTVRRIETEAAHTITIDAASRIAAALGVTIDHLIGDQQ